MAFLTSGPQITVLTIGTTEVQHILADNSSYWQVRVRSLSGAGYLQVSVAETPTSTNSTQLTAVGQIFGVPGLVDRSKMTSPLKFLTDAGTADIEIVEW